MTTAAAAHLYEAQHLHAMEGKENESFNPHNKPWNELPLIMGFSNGGSPGWMDALAISEDGVVLGGHLCSSEGYMPHDLGILKGTRPDRHESSYQKHYPDGYRMEFVSSKDFDGHEKLNNAIKIAKQKQLEAKTEENSDGR